MSRKILLVDDDDDFRDAIKMALEVEDFEVIDVDDGNLADDILKSNKIDLVITDILMPEIEGNELAAEIRKKHPGINIIGMTGGGFIGDADQVKRICAHPLFEEILTKPCSIEKVLAAINKALGASSTLQQDPGLVTPQLASNVDDSARKGEKSAPSFDESFILKQTNGDEEMAKMLAQLLIDSSEKALAEMNESLARGDADALYRIAHNIKGSVGNFGAADALKAAHEVERMAMRNELNNVSKKVETLKQEMARLVDELQLYINRT